MFRIFNENAHHEKNVPCRRRLSGWLAWRIIYRLCQGDFLDQASIGVHPGPELHFLRENLNI